MKDYADILKKCSEEFFRSFISKNFDNPNLGRIYFFADSYKGVFAKDKEAMDLLMKSTLLESPTRLPRGALLLSSPRPSGKTIFKPYGDGKKEFAMLCGIEGFPAFWVGATYRSLIYMGIRGRVDDTGVTFNLGFEHFTRYSEESNDFFSKPPAYC